MKQQYIKLGPAGHQKFSVCAWILFVSTCRDVQNDSSASPVRLPETLQLTQFLFYYHFSEQLLGFLSKNESISHLHLSWKCLRLHWLLASIYKEGSRLGKLLGLSFHGYSQPALCHYWPCLAGRAPKFVTQSGLSLHYSIHSTLSPHYTTESYALFNKTDCQGINIRQHNSIIQQPNSNPTLNAKRDFRASQRWAARKLKGGVGWGAFECFT